MFIGANRALAFSDRRFSCGLTVIVSCVWRGYGDRGRLARPWWVNERRQAMAELRVAGLSTRRSCVLAGISRSGLRYPPRRRENAWVAALQGLFRIGIDQRRTARRRGKNSRLWRERALRDTDDDAAALVPGLNIAMGLGYLLQRVAAIDNWPQRPRLGQLLE